jgi:hypothetical protein
MKLISTLITFFISSCSNLAHVCISVLFYNFSLENQQQGILLSPVSAELGDNHQTHSPKKKTPEITSFCFLHTYKHTQTHLSLSRVHCDYSYSRGVRTAPFRTATANVAGAGREINSKEASILTSPSRV